MIKKNLIGISLAASYILTVLIAGCVPEDSLQWSADGSKGIYSKEGALFLVDGNTGSLTKIADKQTTALWPAISPDGSMLAYSQIIKVDDFNKAFNLLPQAQIKEVKEHADILKQKILTDGIKDGNLPPLEGYNEQHIAWVNWYFVENTGDPSIRHPQFLSKFRKNELTLYQLVVAPASDPNNKTIIMSSSRQLWRQKFSPDSKILAWLIDNVNGKTFEAGFDLYIASLSQNSNPVFVAPAVSCTYDFRQDSRGIAYIKPENENFNHKELVIGSLVERITTDTNGKIIAKPEKESPQSYRCSGPTNEYAGVIYNSWMAVSYARDSRIFFSSTKMNLPSSKIDSEKGSVFCSDTLTNTVNDILPQIALDFTQGNYYLFQLSRDSRKLLLTGNKNTFGIYALGADIENSKILVDVNESFGEDSPPKLVPQWKGPNRISCLVSEKSRYLNNDPNAPHHRKEIVILDDKGSLVQVLSKSWPDELLDY
jgi:Tol biopolymer transport system component